MINIQFTGNSAAFLEGNKNNSFIEMGDEIILIDVAAENFADMRDNGMLQGKKHIHVVMTHTHGDHISGLGCLALYSFFEIQPGFSKKLTVYAPSAIRDDVETVVRILGTTTDYYNGVIAIDEAVTIGEYTFKPFEVPHTPVLQCFAYLIEKGDSVVYYSGDANILPIHVVEDFKEGKIDHLYVDTCIADYPGNVHCHYSIVLREIPEELRSRVTLMHFDRNFPFYQAVEDGFKIATICEMISA